MEELPGMVTDGLQLWDQIPHGPLVLVNGIVFSKRLDHVLELTQILSSS